jgi:hypothetical protein
VGDSFVWPRHCWDQLGALALGAGVRECRLRGAWSRRCATPRAQQGLAQRMQILAVGVWGLPSPRAIHPGLTPHASAVEVKLKEVLERLDLKKKKKTRINWENGKGASQRRGKERRGGGSF